jgi:excisionase family DNA binding protein
MEQQPQVWLTQQQAADRLGVHLRTIERHRAAGRLPTYRAGTSRGLRFRVEDVDALLELDQPNSTAP